MKKNNTKNTTKNSDTDFFEFVKGLLAKRPKFNTKKLADEGCWPVTKFHYHRFIIKKRNGSERQLVSVNHRLKELQSNLARYFDEHYDVSKYAHGFVPSYTSKVDDLKNGDKEVFGRIERSRGVVSNALEHTGKKVVISIDLKDFFPSITFPRVLGMLRTKPYNLTNRQAAIIASLVCLPKELDINRGLPQGAPTSPTLSNLICSKLDYQLGQFAKKYDLNYSRYADDLTLSTNNIRRISPKKIIEVVTRHVERNGFQVNDAKTKVMYQNSRQIVTGIVVNDGLNLHKKHVDALKATLYNLENNYDSLNEAVIRSLSLKGRQPFDTFMPLEYREGIWGRYVSYTKKGVKRLMPISKREMHKIYALHLLGRILWYGQVVTTAVQNPYNLNNSKNISPKQTSRIRKYEEFLASFYRVSLKFNWDMEHIVLRLANRFMHLQSLVNTHSSLLLEPIILTECEQNLKNEVFKLKSDKSLYKKFFDNSPATLQRALRARNPNINSFDLYDIKKLVDEGWPDPYAQKGVLKQLDTGELSDLFHKSTDGAGHSAKYLVEVMVSIIKPRQRYLSSEVGGNLSIVHRELLKLIRSHGEDVRINFEKSSKEQESALQAVNDLKTAVRLNEDDTDNFYTRVVLPSIRESGMTNIVRIDKSDMQVRMATDIRAWKNALKKVLDSVKQHMQKSECDKKVKDDFPFTVALREFDPETERPMAIEIYRKDTSLSFKKIPELEPGKLKGKVLNRMTGGDLSKAVKEFLPVGDIFVHGSFGSKEKMVMDITINLTDHSYKKESMYLNKEYGQLMFSLVELGA